MTIIRVPDGLLKGLPAGDYDIADPRLKGRGVHWVTQGWVVIASSDEPTPSPVKPKKGAK